MRGDERRGEERRGEERRGEERREERRGEERRGEERRGEERRGEERRGGRGAVDHTLVSDPSSTTKLSSHLAKCSYNLFLNLYIPDC